MAANEAMREGIESLRSIYQCALKEGKTRQVKLLGRKCRPRILYTFLGFELKMGRRRITCPDMATARYLRIFAELGLSSARIPYDPTRTARLVPELEAAMDAVKQSLLRENDTRRRHLARVRRTYGKIRRRLGEIAVQ